MAIKVKKILRHFENTRTSVPAKLFLGVLLLGLAGCESYQHRVAYRWALLKESAKPGPRHLYTDPQKRFYVSPPGLRDLVVRETEEGVVFNGRNPMGDEVNYGILVYHLPDGMPIGETTLLKTADRIRSRLRGMGHDVEQLTHDPITFNNYVAFDLKYYVAFENGTYRLYISRMVKTESEIFNFYYSIPVREKIPFREIGGEHLAEAERWYYTVTLFPR